MTTSAPARRPGAQDGTPSRMPVAAVRLAAVAAPLLVAVTVALHLHNGRTDLTSWWLGDVLLTLLLLVPGVLVAAKRPDNVIGWLLLLASASTALSGAGREYLAFGVLGGNAPGYLWTGWVTDALFPISMSMLPLILLFFPDGRLLSPRARAWVAVALASMASGIFGALFFTDPGGVDVGGHRLYNPARHVFPAWVADGAGTLSWLLFLVAVVAAITLVTMRYRRSGTEVRTQMKWVVWSGSIALVELATEFIPGNRWSQFTGPVASSLISVTICVAILRHRLFDIDLVIKRTVVYAVLSLGVAGLYVAVVTATGAALDRRVQLGPGLIATAVVAITFGPARTWLQGRVDRLLYGDRRDPYQVMSSVGHSLDNVTASDELRVVVQTVAQALRIPYAAILDPEGRRLAEHGIAIEQPVAVHLAYQGRPMGRLLVGPRRHESGFARDEMRLLDDLGRQIGAAVHAVRLSADLQASRARLVTAKEEERRRLRRDLHDGLGPKLAALGLKVDAAHALTDDRPEDSKQLMSTVAADIRSTIDDIRRLVYGLRPPALDELGLVDALREATGRFDDVAAPGSALPQITLDAPARLPDLPAAVEVAAYRIVTEAVTNAVRHAGAGACTVRIGVDRGDALCLSVSDDGSGLPAGWRPGIGTSSMHERAEELGGELTLRPGPDRRGTEVRATIPCRSPE